MAADGRRRVQLVTVLVLAGTFVAGGAAGAGLMRFLAPALPVPPPPLPLHELNLTPTQQRQVQAIHERHYPEVEAIVRATFPRVRAVEAEVDQEVRAVLTPEQLRRYESLKARRPPPASQPGPPPAGLKPPGAPPPGALPPGAPPPR